VTAFTLHIYAQNEADVPPDLRALASLCQIPYDPDKMMEAPSQRPSCVLCFSAQGKMSPEEIAQTLRMIYPGVPMFYVALDPAEFEKKRLIKNGFNEAFLLPWEKKELARAMEEEMLYTKIPAMRDYRPVKVVDLVPGTELTFDTKIFLPTNNKFLVFARDGETITAERLLLLESQKQSSLFVHKDAMQEFIKYTVKSFEAIGRSEESATVKERKLKTGIRELVSDLFVQDTKANTFGRSSVLLNDLQETVRSMVDEVCPGVLKKLDQMINQESDFYGHLSRVATYATLFAIALKVEFPVDLGLAGLLHDIGLTALPAQAVDVPYEKLSKELKAAYDQHPQLSIDIIRLKRMVVKERVQKAILQHHERLDGTGTPHQLSGRKVLPEAQILAIATAFDDLTTLTPGRPPLTPIAAFEHLLQLHGGDPTRMGIDVNLIRKLREIYCAKEGDV
jgi:HD-GYP domain-containing protein (c-di-GMP phosphodiesterase class II)